MRERKNVYDLSNEELLCKLIDLSGRAGVSASGLVISLGGPDYFSDLRVLKGVVLSRLEGKKAPFKIGDRVLPKGSYRIIGRTQRSGGYSSLEPFTFNESVVVRMIVYLGIGTWELWFNGINSDGGGPPVRFGAEYFVLCSVSSAT